MDGLVLANAVEKICLLLLFLKISFEIFPFIDCLLGTMLPHRLDVMYAVLLDRYCSWLLEDMTYSLDIDIDHSINS
ncbi:CLUMA_CG020796, isoform A [Clunio marinus]|uniref:CLUMA_CG020796, isoform A n=1 Tax=Clunio marinus TaxID=568069 RepID=A0A1J1J780_9DIPT|nr:CLUMA_CG020796, isoform A [Clunio marinus]